MTNKEPDQESIRLGLTYIHKVFELAKIHNHRANEAAFDLPEAEDLLSSLDCLWRLMDSETKKLCSQVCERFNEVEDIIIELRKNRD